jgi:TPR repeat protein
VPIYHYSEAKEDLAGEDMEKYYPCCGKSICAGCMFLFDKADNDKCPFCNSDQADKTDEEMVADMMKRAETNDAASIYLMAGNYHHGRVGLQQDHTKAMDLYARAAELGCSKAHCNLGLLYHEGGNMKKAKFHLEAAAMAGQEVARSKLGLMEAKSGNMERAVKHWKIAASAGNFTPMQLATCIQRRICQ